MFATVRRYQSVDETRIAEIATKVDHTLMPRLSKLPGFGGYYLIESDKGVLTSFSLFETSAQADESGRVAAKWLKDEHLDAIVPDAPKVTTGTVLAHTTNTAILA